MTVVIAHRGIPVLAEENTIESFQLVIEHNIPLVEFDIQFTADGVPVVFHDDDLLRLCGNNKNIEDCRFATLPTTLKGGRIESLENVFQLFESSHTFMHVEIKNPKATNRVLELIRTYNMSDRCIISSFEHTVLNDVHAQAPKQHTLALFDHWNDLTNSTQSAHALGVDFNSWKQSLQPINHTRPVFCFTVNNHIDFSLARRYGFFGVYTDTPIQLMEQL